MKVLILGEIIGRPGRTKLKEVLPKMLKKMKPDFVIANGEHIAGGKGLTEEKVEEMTDLGIDFFTTGNHVFSQKIVKHMLEDESAPVVRPANYPPGVAGKEYKVTERNGKRILVINLMGRTFIRDSLDDPFRKADDILKKVQADVIIVDMHAETTSEKILMGDYLNGRVSIVFGSHTHVPTSDSQILDKGTYYVTDIGMIGPKDSVIGMKKEVSEDRILKQIPSKYEVAPYGPSYFNACLVELDKSEKAVKFDKIEKIV